MFVKPSMLSKSFPTDLKLLWASCWTAGSTLLCFRESMSLLAHPRYECREDICLLSHCYDGGFRSCTPGGCSWILGAWGLEGPHTLLISKQNLTWVIWERKEHLIRSFSNSPFLPSIVSFWFPCKLSGLPSHHPTSFPACYMFLLVSPHFHWWRQLPIMCDHSLNLCSRPQLLSWLIFTYATFVCFPLAVSQTPLTQVSFSSLLPLSQTCISNAVKGMSITGHIAETWKVIPLPVSIQCN